jgi:EF-hand domain pair
MNAPLQRLTGYFGIALLTCFIYITPAAADDIVSFATGGYASGLRTKDTMHKMDANGDGMVSKDEWMNFQEKMFAALDKDKSGYLDQTEFTGPMNENLAFATAAYAHGLMTDEMFKKVDTNGDGKISREEFLAYHRKIFDMLDKQKKGMVGLVDFIHPAGS